MYTLAQKLRDFEDHNFFPFYLDQETKFVATESLIVGENIKYKQNN